MSLVTRRGDMSPKVRVYFQKVYTASSDLSPVVASDLSRQLRGDKSLVRVYTFQRVAATVTDDIFRATGDSDNEATFFAKAQF